MGGGGGVSNGGGSGGEPAAVRTGNRFGEICGGRLTAALSGKLSVLDIDEYPSSLSADELPVVADTGSYESSHSSSSDAPPAGEGGGAGLVVLVTIENDSLSVPQVGRHGL